MKNLSFKKEVKTIQKNCCPICGKKINLINEFKDELSKKEYAISGLCQQCQNITFNDNDTSDFIDL